MRSPKTDWKVNKINEQSELAVKVTGTNMEFRYEGTLSTNIENLSIMIYQLDLFGNKFNCEPMGGFSHEKYLLNIITHE